MLSPCLQPLVNLKNGIRKHSLGISTWQKIEDQLTKRDALAKLIKSRGGRHPPLTVCQKLKHTTPLGGFAVGFRHGKFSVQVGGVHPSKAREIFEHKLRAMKAHQTETALIRAGGARGCLTDNERTTANCKGLFERNGGPTVYVSDGARIRDPYGIYTKGWSGTGTIW